MLRIGDVVAPIGFGSPGAELRDLSSTLRSGRLTASSSAMAFERIMSKASAANAMKQDRARKAIPDELMQLVITGPDAANAVRDTAVVVRDVFATAEESVLVAGYAVYQGLQVFQALADLMELLPREYRIGPAGPLTGARRKHHRPFRFDARAGIFAECFADLIWSCIKSTSHASARHTNGQSSLLKTCSF